MKVPQVDLNIQLLGKTQEQVIDKALKLITNHKISKKMIATYAITNDEIVDNLVEFLNMKDSLDFPQVYPWIYNISRVNGVLVFKRLAAKNNYSKNITRAINLLYTQISNPNIDDKVSKIKQTTNERKNIVAKIKILRDALEQNKSVEFLKSMYLYGKRASGKTYICSAIANTFATRGISTVYVKSRELFTFLTKKLNDNRESYNEIISDLQNVSLLIVDDLGLEKANDWFRYEVLSSIFKTRNENNKLTIIASPLNWKELEESYLAEAKTPKQKYSAESLVYEIKQKKDEYCVNDWIDF
ncbi:ATP-binding protein [Mycoplasmopsis adleri]|uniref:ATP-binding protein n=1 Tax=Mycoplasmopsis adleri TaxID=51362 RepID=UPI0038738FAA